MTAATTSTPEPELPDAIDRYQHAHDHRDTATALAAFTAHATVIDEDSTYRGADEIRGWLDHAASEYTYTRTLIGIEPVADDVWLVHNRLDGNFPGGTAELRYRFTLHGGLIDRLEIAP